MKRRLYCKQRRMYVDGMIEFLEKDTEYGSYIKSNEQYAAYVEQNQRMPIVRVMLFDVYGNKQMNKMVKRISEISRTAYSVDLTLRPKKFKDLNYLRLQYEGSSMTLLGHIGFLHHNFIRTITISFTQINNNQALIEFDFHLKRTLNNETLLDFIKEARFDLYADESLRCYDLQQIVKSGHFAQIQRMYIELGKAAFQSLLKRIVPSELGQDYKLPSCVVRQVPDGVFDKSSFRNIFLHKSYQIDDGEQFLVTDITSSNGLEMELYCIGSKYKEISFINLANRYRMNFYYFLFSSIERIEMNRRMNKYFNESQNKISVQDYKWLINKIRTINDNKLHMQWVNTNPETLANWKAFYNGNEVEIDFISNAYCQRYETIYGEVLDHIRTVNGLQKENLIIRLSFGALVASVIGIVVTGLGYLLK